MTKAQNLTVVAGLSAALALSGSWPAAAAYVEAGLLVRVFLQGAAHFPAYGPCSAITVTVKGATPLGPPVTMSQPATGPNQAPVGKCTAYFTFLGGSVLSGTTIELSATYLGMISKPNTEYAQPYGNWSNPFALKLGNQTKYITIYGKP
jgi:hypothetical protein